MIESLKHHPTKNKSKTSRVKEPAVPQLFSTRDEITQFMTLAGAHLVRGQPAQ